MIHFFPTFSADACDSPFARELNALEIVDAGRPVIAASGEWQASMPALMRAPDRVFNKPGVWGKK